MPEERALIGTKEIADYLRWTTTKVRDHSKRMQAAGALTTQVFGRPPCRHRKLYTFPSLLQRYLVSKV